MKMQFVYFLLMLSCKVGIAQWVQSGIGYELPNTVTFGITSNNPGFLWAFCHYPWPLNAYHYQIERSYCRSSDGGLTWEINELNVPDTFSRELTCVLNFDTAWIGMGAVSPSHESEKLLRTHDGGVTWEEKSPPWLEDSLQEILFMHFFNDLYGLAIGIKSTGISALSFAFLFYRTDDGGETWTLVPDTNYPVAAFGEFSVSFSTAGNNVWITTSQNHILKSQDKGEHWDFIWSPIPNYSGFSYILFHSETQGIIKYTGNTGSYHLFETNDGGQTWLPFNFSGPMQFMSTGLNLTYVPGSVNTFVSYNEYGCSYSIDGCHTWSSFPDLSGVPIYDAAFSDLSHGWAGGINSLPDIGNTGFYRYNGTLVSILNKDPLKGGLTIFPNPSRGDVEIHIIGFEGHRVYLSIVNMNGQCVYKEVFIQDKIQSLRTYNFDWLPAGVYTLCLQDGQNRVAERMVIAGD